MDDAGCFTGQRQWSLPVCHCLVGAACHCRKTHACRSNAVLLTLSWSSIRVHWSRKLSTHGNFNFSPLWKLRLYMMIQTPSNRTVYRPNIASLISLYRWQLVNCGGRLCVILHELLSVKPVQKNYTVTSTPLSYCCSNWMTASSTMLKPSLSHIIRQHPPTYMPYCQICLTAWAIP